MPHPLTDGYFLLQTVIGRAAKENKVQMVQNEVAAEAVVQQQQGRTKLTSHNYALVKMGGKQKSPQIGIVKMAYTEKALSCV